MISGRPEDNISFLRRRRLSIFPLPQGRVIENWKTSWWSSGLPTALWLRFLFSFEKKWKSTKGTVGNPFFFPPSFLSSTTGNESSKLLSFPTVVEESDGGKKEWNWISHVILYGNPKTLTQRSSRPSIRPSFHQDGYARYNPDGRSCWGNAES